MDSGFRRNDGKGKAFAGMTRKELDPGLRRDDDTRAFVEMTK
jgi:hypothetical protein